MEEKMARDILVDPPPPVSFGDTVATPLPPLRVSRIIWMAPMQIYFFQICETL